MKSDEEVFKAILTVAVTFASVLKHGLPIANYAKERSEKIVELVDEIIKEQEAKDGKSQS